MASNALIAEGLVVVGIEGEGFVEVFYGFVIVSSLVLFNPFVAGGLRIGFYGRRRRGFRGLYGFCLLR